MIYQVEINKVPPNLEIAGAIDATLLYSHKQDIYSQIFVLPDYINVGNVSQDTTYNVVLWNAKETQETLNSITETGTDGILLTGIESGLINSNAYITYSVEVTTLGPSVIDATYTFNMDSGTTSTLSIEGSRVVLFGFDVNWSQLPKESYSHYTDVRIAYDGTEYRHNLTENPRMMLEYYYTLDDADRMKLDGLLYSWADKIFLVPIYSQLTKTSNAITAGDTSVQIELENTDIQEGMSLLFGNIKDNVINVVTGVINNVVTFNTAFSKDFPENTYVTPLCQSYINSESNTAHQTQNLTEMLATFTIKDDTILTITNSIDNFEEYQGLKVLTDEPNRRVTINRAYSRLTDIIDYGSGVRARVTKDKKPAVVFNYTFDCIGKNEISNIKAFFNNMRGMADEFLVSTFTADMKLAEPIGATDTTLVIENTGVGTYYFNNNQKDHVIFYLSDGTTEIRQIINVLGNDNNTERLIIDSPFNKNLDISQVNSIQFLSNARFNSDTIQFEYETDEYARATIEIRILR